MAIDRRTLLKSTAATTAVGGPFAGLAAMPAQAHQAPRAQDLVPVKDRRDGVVRLHLPRGFRYRSFHDTESPVRLTDGTALPGRHDGMGAFRGPNDTVLLVRNHEVNNPQPFFGPGDPYDEMGGGGTTTIQITRQGHVIRAHTSLNGTMMNCSGGEMPWGSWITCEETVNGPDVGPDFTGASNVPLQKRHGYIFEVPVSAQPGKGQSNRRPIHSAGRFAHEAVSFDPVKGHLYLTEDNFGFASGFYRYKPPAHPMQVGRLRDGGKLQMLKVVGVDNAHLEGHQRQGKTYDVEWVTIPDPDVEYDYTPGVEAPTTNNTAITHVGRQGWAKGAAFFSRLEGQVYHDGVIFFTSTEGGGPRGGRKHQLRRLRQRLGAGLGLPHEEEEAALRLPVDRPVDPRPARQRHHLQQRDPGGLRGQLRRQLPARPDPARRHLGHRAQPTGGLRRHRAVRRRVRGLDVQSRRQDALRQHPGEPGHDLRDLGSLGRDRRLSRPAFLRLALPHDDMAR